METNPEGTAQTYIFLVDNQDIALNIVMSGYQALCLVQEDDGAYSARTAHPFQRNGAPFRFKLSKAQQVD